MTREEAINEMRKIIFELGFEPDGTDVDSRAKALEMAIKALSDKHKDRKKAKRFKRKYAKLKTAIFKIRSEIENKRIEKPGGHWQLGIALDIIDKHLKEANE